MIYAEAITIDTFIDRAQLDELTVVIKQLAETNDVSEARDYYVAIESIVSQDRQMRRDNPEVYRRATNMLTMLGFLALQTLSEERVVELLREHILFAIHNNMNLADNLDAFFRLHQDGAVNFLSRNNCAHALLENNELLGSEKIQYANENEFDAPTVRNWLRDFSRSFASDRYLSKLDEIEYLNTNANVRKLSPTDREVLKRLLDVYTMLRFPRRSVTEVRDTGHRTASVSDAKTEMVQPQYKSAAVPMKDPIANLKRKYAEYRINRQRILDLEDTVLVASKGDPHAIYHELSAAAQGGDKFRAIACLKLLARQQALAESLKANPAWWEATAEYITKKYTGRFPVPEVKLAVSDLKYNPTSPEVISEFLQFILENRLRISGSESALIGVEIGQLTGGAFQSMAYGNAETGEFEWVKNKIADRKLISEM